MQMFSNDTFLPLKQILASRSGTFHRVCYFNLRVGFDNLFNNKNIFLFNSFGYRFLLPHMQIYK